MEKLIKQSEVNCFLSEIEQIFPNFVAGVLCDYHGFPIASKIPYNFPIRENLLALLAISNKVGRINEKKYLKVKRDLDKSKNIKMLLLLKKSNQKIANFKKLKEFINTSNLF
ncbi:MAG: hypothetical protein ACFFAO_11505 [Candidatus Hermodarchaeota archaeon]